MTCHSDYETIIDTVSMSAIAQMYGFEVDRKGRILCPFHNDNNPSLKIYNNNGGWYCFVCAAGGNIITFVSRFFNINYRSAAQKIDRDFALGISNRKHDEAEISAYQREKMRKEAELSLYRGEYNSKSKEFKKFRSCLVRPQNNNHNQAQEYARIISKLEFLDYWFSCHEWR